MARTRSTPQEVWTRHQPGEAYEHVEHFFAGAFHGATEIKPKAVREANRERVGNARSRHIGVGDTLERR